MRAKGIRPDLTATLPDPLLPNRRTPEETVTGIYWAYDGAVGLGTPPRFYNEIVRRVTFQQGNTEGQNARRAAAAASSDESAEETATGAAARAGNAQESWPFGIAEQDQPSNTVQGAWPSGISEK